MTVNRVDKGIMIRGSPRERWGEGGRWSKREVWLAWRGLSNRKGLASVELPTVTKAARGVS